METTHKRGSEATYVDRAGQNGLAHSQLLAGLGQVPIRMKKSFGHATVAPKRGLVVCIVHKKLAPCVKEERSVDEQSARWGATSRNSASPFRIFYK